MPKPLCLGFYFFGGGKLVHNDTKLQITLQNRAYMNKSKKTSPKTSSKQRGANKASPSPKAKGKATAKRVVKVIETAEGLTSTQLTGEAKHREGIIQLLTEVGVYNPSFNFLIESCSQLVEARNTVYAVMTQSEPIVKETSREGEARLRAHPIYNIYIEINKELRQVLGELTMTARTSSVSQGDALDILNEKLRKLLNS